MFKKLLIGLVVLLVVLFVARDFIVKTAVVKGVKAVTGLELQVKSIKIGITNPTVEIKELQLFNPPNFEDKLMIDLPEIFANYDLGAFIKSKIHLREIRLNLKEFVVEKNAKGELNLDYLKAISKKEAAPEEKAPEEKAKMPEIKIDLLLLKVGKVIYKDYSKGTPPKVMEFNINLDERYENVTNPYELIGLIIYRVLVNTTIAELANFNMGDLKGKLGDKFTKAQEILQSYTGKAADISKDFAAQAQGVAGKTTDIAGPAANTAKDAVNDVADKIKSLFPFGNKEGKK